MGRTEKGQSLVYHLQRYDHSKLGAESIYDTAVVYRPLG
ncbi:hypothetical protein JCM19233_591 [Vibrio astriarenae]|nr:hypothetical protein JCM19233_591 [Vibrio sp. C7]